MKTSVIMTRTIGEIDFFQRTGDGYFEANALLIQWNKSNKNHSNRIRIDKFLSNDKTKEFIDELYNEIHGDFSTHGSKGVVIRKKGRITPNGRTKDEIWMHPYLFIDFAMWINPKFKLSVVKFVYDQLIQQRTLAGDNYKTFSSSLVKLKGYSFQEAAKAIQWIVYNKTGKELRQTATEAQLQEINDIQTKFAFAIDMNYITSYNQLMDELRKLWYKKHSKF